MLLDISAFQSPEDLYTFLLTPEGKKEARRIKAELRKLEKEKLKDEALKASQNQIELPFLSQCTIEVAPIADPVFEKPKGRAKNVACTVRVKLSFKQYSGYCDITNQSYKSKVDWINKAGYFGYMVECAYENLIYHIKRDIRDWSYRNDPRKAYCTLYSAFDSFRYWQRFIKDRLLLLKRFGRSFVTTSVSIQDSLNSMVI